MTAAELTAAVRQSLEAARNPEQAVPMARYMRNLFPFLGLKRPQLNDCLRPIWAGVKPAATEKLIVSASRQIWKLPEREFQHAVIDLLGRNHKLLTPASIGLLRELIVSKSWWDSVDGITSWVVGPLVERHRNLASEMDAWSVDGNFWLRRAAIIHQLGFKQNTDAARLFDYCARNARDSEFFIRKGIGWALRQYARTDPRAVHQFVDAHSELSVLSKREALKHFGYSRPATAKRAKPRKRPQ